MFLQRYCQSRSCYFCNKIGKLKETLSQNMAIDILRFVNSDDIMNDCKEISELECFKNYMQDADGAIPITPLFVYVILLYSKDSFLNKMPLEELRKRKQKAANLSGLDFDIEVIREFVAELKSERVVELILGYLIHQSSFEFTELCVIEAQIEESQRIRMRSFDAEKDKDLAQAFEKKGALVRSVKEWYDIKKGYEKIIFAPDHDDVRKSKVAQSATLESYAR